MNAERGGVLEELKRSFELPVYEGFDVVWIAVIKIANLLPGSDERARLSALVDRLPGDSIRHILQQPEVDALLNLQPPLETLLSYAHERVNAPRTAEELEMVRLHRQDDPNLALRNLVAVLQRVRNRRAHGFKTPDGPRDQEILQSALVVIRHIGALAAKVIAESAGPEKAASE